MRQETRLGTITESVDSELEARPLLRRILRHACEPIGADSGSIGLVVPERGVVRTEAVYRMPASELGAGLGRGHARRRAGGGSTRSTHRGPRDAPRRLRDACCLFSRRRERKRRWGCTPAVPLPDSRAVRLRRRKNKTQASRNRPGAPRARRGACPV